VTTPLTSFLLGRGDPPSVAALRQTQLASYAYTVLPAEHPWRTELRSDFLAACVQHHAIRRDVAPLLAAWCDAGIPAMFFKGFHLSEFHYAVPSTRFHGDVDVLIHPAHAERAVGVARDLGWDDAHHSARAHGICGLRAPGAPVTMVDLHRFPLHGSFRWSRRRRSITEAIWQRAHERAWEGTVVHVPDPTDAFLLLVLHRAWGAERWRLKPHDVLDVRALMERAGVTLEAVRARAAELGCSRTLGLFLDRCNPAAGRLELAHPSRMAALRWDLAVMAERRTPGLGVERLLLRLAHAPGALVDVIAALPTLFRVERALRAHTDLRQLLAALTPAVAPTPSSWRARARAARGIRWAVRLLRLRAGGPCVVRSLALYIAFRRLGWPATFVSGVRRGPAGVVGHAWVELNGCVLPELSEPLNRSWFQVNVEYPAVAEAGAGSWAPSGDGERVSVASAHP
jgi:hypothetical protein